MTFTPENKTEQHSRENPNHEALKWVKSNSLAHKSKNSHKFNLKAPEQN